MRHPWRDLRNMPEVTLRFADLPPGLLGFCDHDTLTIWLTNGMRQRQRRAVLQHELEHLERGRVFSHFVDREERAVEEATARTLIPIGEFVAALRWTRDLRELADELHVPVDLVAVRWHRMKHPAELAAVAAVIADRAELDTP